VEGSSTIVQCTSCFSNIFEKGEKTMDMKDRLSGCQLPMWLSPGQVWPTCSHRYPWPGCQCKVHPEKFIYCLHKLTLRNISNHMQLIILLTLGTICTHLSISLRLIYSQKENDVYWTISVSAAKVAVAMSGRLGQLAAIDIHGPGVDLRYILKNAYTTSTN
jgi:hypothetical protein